MKIVSLDPSSTCTGYAAFEIRQSGLRLLDGGRLRSKGDVVRRVLDMRLDLRNVLHDHVPAYIIVEVPTGKQQTRNPERKSGFPVWAMAAGALWMVCEEWAADREVRYALQGPRPQVVPVSNEWTRGQGKKPHRKIMAHTMHPAYDPATDKGGDIADAICLAEWWWRRCGGAVLRAMAASDGR